MSMPSLHIRCQRCDFEQVVPMRPITLKYVLPDGNVLTTGRHRGWCDDCNNIGDIEPLFNASEISIELLALREEERAAARSGLRRAIERLLGRRPPDFSEKARDIELRLRIAALRKTPPQCLRCRGTSVTALAFGEDGLSKDFVHTCGGRLYLPPFDPDGPRISFRPTVLSMDVEGRML